MASLEARIAKLEAQVASASGDSDSPWRRGDLSGLLHASQLEVRERFRGSSGRFVLEKGRRWGGTYFAVNLACETCLQRPGGRVVYGAPTLKHLKEFVLPAFDKIAATAPKHMRPRFNVSNSHIEFHNGSWIHLFGCDDQRQADTGAGNDAELAIFDEAGAVGVASLLGYIIRSIFRPSLQTTGGRILLLSSPPRIPDHEFTVMAEKAEARGAYARRTVFDNPRLTEQQREDFIKTDAEDEGMPLEEYRKSDTFRREYMAERVIDRTLVVLPEWADARTTQLVALPRPEFFDAQVTLDFGGVDPHAAHFGYLDFHRAGYVIEDEVLLRDGENTESLVRALKEKERQLWGTDRWAGTLRAIQERHENVFCPDWIQAEIDEEAPKQPRVRWADNDIQLCRDLHELHGYSVVPTAKDNLELQVNRLRLLVGELKVFVHPRCVHTDRHWRSTTWANHRRQDFARKSNEHGDLLATGVYGVRGLDRSRNPFPPGWNQEPGLRYREKPRETTAQRLGRALRTR